MTLDELTAEESRLLGIIERAAGSMSQKDRRLADEGVFAAYAEVHRAYVEAAESTGDAEALKRAVFLQWYSLSEPSCFTGLSKLHPRAERRAAELLEREFERHGIDPEFGWMIPYYYRITDFYLNGFEDLRILNELSRREEVLWRELKPAREELLGRGQMGKYWISVYDARQGR